MREGVKCEVRASFAGDMRGIIALLIVVVTDYVTGLVEKMLRLGGMQMKPLAMLELDPRRK